MAPKRTNANPGATISSAIGEAVSNALTSVLAEKLKGSALESVLSFGRPKKENGSQSLDEATKRFEKSVSTFETIVNTAASKGPSQDTGPAPHNDGAQSDDIEKQTAKVEKLSSAFQAAKTSALDLKVQVEDTAGTDRKGGIGQLISQMEIWKESTEDLRKASNILSKTHEALGRAVANSSKDMAANAVKSSTKTIAANVAATASSGAMGVAGATGNSMLFPPPINFVLLAAGVAAVIGSLAMAAKVASSGGAKGFSVPAAPSTPSISIPNQSRVPMLGSPATGVQQAIPSIVEAATQSNTIGASDNRNDPGRTDEIVGTLETIRDNTKPDREPEIRARAVDNRGRVIPTRKDVERQREGRAPQASAPSNPEDVSAILQEEAEQTRLLRAISASLSKAKPGAKPSEQNQPPKIVAPEAKRPREETPETIGKEPQRQNEPAPQPAPQPEQPRTSPQISIAETSSAASKPTAETAPETPKAASTPAPTPQPAKSEKTGTAKLVDNITKSPEVREIAESFKQSPVVKAVTTAKKLFSGVFGTTKPKEPVAEKQESPPTPEKQNSPSTPAPTERGGEAFSPDKEITAQTKLDKFKELFFRRNRERQKIEREEARVDDEQSKKIFSDRMRESELKIAQRAKEEVAGTKAFLKEKAQNAQKLAMGKARMLSDKLEVLTKIKGNAAKMASDAIAFAKEKGMAMMTIAIRGAKAAASMVQKAMMWPFPVNAIALASGAALIAGGILYAKKLLSGDSGGGGPAAEGGEAPSEKQEDVQGGKGTTPDEAKRLARDEVKEKKSSAGSKLTDTFWKLTVATIVMLLKKIADGSGSPSSGDRSQTQSESAGSSFGNGNALNPHSGSPRDTRKGNGSTQTDVADSFSSIRYSSNMTRNS